MYHSKSAPVSDVPTTGLFVPTVLNVATCNEHGALLNEPCHVFESLVSERSIEGICNARAKMAGMNGSIDPRSLSTRRSAGA